MLDVFVMRFKKINLAIFLAIAIYIDCDLYRRAVSS